MIHLKKLIFISLFLVLAQLASVTAQSELSMVIAPVPPTEPGTTATVNFDLINTGGDKTVNFVSTDLISGQEKIDAPIISSIFIKENKTLFPSFNVNIPGVPSGTYTGTLTATAIVGNQTHTAEQSYQITVQRTLAVTTPNTQSSVDPQTTATITFTATNTGESSKLVKFSSTDLTDGTNTITVPTKTQLIEVGSESVTIDIAVPATLAGSYSGTITAQEVTNIQNNATSGAYILTVSPKAVLTSDKTQIIITKPADTTGTSTFILSNLGSLSITPVLTIVGNLTDNDGDVITSTITSPGVIKPGETPTVTVTATLPNGIDLDTYDADITISTGFLETDSVIDFKIKVEPEICKDGRVSESNPVNGPGDGNIRIKINEPDNKDDFSPNDEMDIEVNVDNKDDQNMDVVVEAVLYNLNEDEEIASVESSSKEINDGSDEDFDLTLKVPTDGNLDENDDIRLYVKAFEDGDEEKNCNFDSVGIDIKRENHQVVVKDFTINPSSVSCNEVVNFVVGVENIGKKKEDDVEIRITHPELGLDLISNKFDLGKFDKSDNDARKSFSFQIPGNVIEKSYAIMAEVFFRNGDESNSETEQLTVLNCQGGSQALAGTSTLLQSSFSITPGRVFAIPVSLQNTGTNSAIYQIEVNPSGDWASPATEQTTLDPGQSTTVFTYLTPQSNLDQGSYSASVSVRQDGNVVSTNTITANFGSTPTGATTFQGTYTINSFTRNWIDNGRIFWILGIVVLIVLIVFFSKLVMKRN